MSQLLAVTITDCVLQGKTVTLKIKTVTFEVHTRAQTMTQHTNDAHQINLVASRLLRTEIDNVAPKPLELRLMGKHLVSLDRSSLSFSMLRVHATKKLCTTKVNS